jgi:hypothetical protein
MALLSSAAFAQQPPPGGRPDFEQMQKQWLDRAKESLGTDDQEWKVLGPRIQHVQQLQHEASARGMMFGPRPFPPPGGPDGAPPPAGAPNLDNGQRPDVEPPRSAVQESAADLQDALGDKDATAGEIKARLIALREARIKARAALTQAQDELRELLTARQEAVLVSLGVLE